MEWSYCVEDYHHYHLLYLHSRLSRTYKVAVTVVAAVMM